jgi:hypothetical protein
MPRRAGHLTATSMLILINADGSNGSDGETDAEGEKLALGL